MGGGGSGAGPHRPKMAVRRRRHRVVSNHESGCRHPLSGPLSIGRTLEHDKLFVVGGDWNLDPALVEMSGLARRDGSLLFVPP
eukprot:7241773-Pyramimonas_sp.AAC.1